MEIISGGIEEQTQQALKNLKAVVEASGSELGKVVKTTVSEAFFKKNFDPSPPLSRLWRSRTWSLILTYLTYPFSVRFS